MNLIRFGCGVTMTTDRSSPPTIIIRHFFMMAAIDPPNGVSGLALTQTDDLLELFRHVLDNNVIFKSVRILCVFVSTG